MFKTASQAIYQGLSTEGGLFVPAQIPKIAIDEIAKMSSAVYPQLAVAILSKYLDDFTAEEIEKCVKKAYGKNFDRSEIAPLRRVNDDFFSLELWHGPTCAFKDMALQLLPHLLVKSKEKSGDDKTVVILVATSGDTGKAALEGFCDVAGTRIMVFYPENGVSPIQKLQMQTQPGENVMVCAVEGNFDDAQSGVKEIFSDIDFNAHAHKSGFIFSSANSINWGRLVPQIVYYFSAYAQLLATGQISAGEEMNVCVPTGNFGNILAAYYAREMGLPIGKLICASNENNVLTDFINTGTYDKNRAFHMTSSPSMDILISSNLERLLFHMSGEDDHFVDACFAQLSQSGSYSVPAEMHREICNLFYADWCGEAETAATIQKFFEQDGYLMDTHTAVAFAVAEKYIKNTDDHRPMIVVSTANPYKFANSVLEAIAPKSDLTDDFNVLKTLENHSGLKTPEQLSCLSDKQIRFTHVCAPEKMCDEVRAFIK